MAWQPPDEDTSDVQEPGDFFSPGEHNFSHQSLIMIGIKKCLDLGSQELREGWWEEKIDKSGNITKHYNPDTRKAFIEAVKSLMMITEYDWDEDARNNINNFLQYIKDRKKYWMEQEYRWWCSLSPPQRQQMQREGKTVVQGAFNSKLEFDNYFHDEETDAYRRICTEINNQAGRLDWYDTEDYGA